MTLDDRLQTRVRFHEARGSTTDAALYRDVQDELTRLRAHIDQLEDERDNLQWPGQNATHRDNLTPPDEALTPREASVLPLLLQGHTYKQIGRALGIGPETVKGHCSRLYGKYGVQNRAGLLGALGMRP